MDTRRDLLIVSAGGYGREILGYIEDDNPVFRFKGFLDNRADILKGIPRHFSIVGDPLTYVPGPNDVFFAALGDPQQRRKYTAALREVHNATFVTVRHPRANVSRHANIGLGCMIGPG